MNWGYHSCRRCTHQRFCNRPKNLWTITIQCLFKSSKILPFGSASGYTETPQYTTCKTTIQLYLVIWWHFCKWNERLASRGVNGGLRDSIFQQWPNHRLKFTQPLCERGFLTLRFVANDFSFDNSMYLVLNLVASGRVVCCWQEYNWIYSTIILLTTP